MKFEFNKEYLKIIVDLTIYNIDVLHKCFYWYGLNYSVDIEKRDEQTGVIKIFPKDSAKNLTEFNSLVDKIRNDLINFKTRDIVTKETKNVRDLLIAKAFSHSDEFDSEPQGEIADSIGFDPSV